MNKRLDYLDAIRGLAIIGILFMNINSFSWPDIYDSFPSAYWNTPLDRWAESFTYVFVQSNLYPVFAFLFGVSMSFIFNSAVQKGLNPYVVFSRRLLFLLLIGAAHAFLVWHGDILVIYALLGFILLPLYRFTTRTILITATAIWAIPNIFYALLLFLSGSHLSPSADLQVIQKVISHYHGGLLERFNQNLTDWFIQYDIQTLPFIFISIFPMFLLGLAISKSGYLLKINQHAADHRMLWMITGIVGLTLKILPIIDPSYLLFFHLSEAFGGPLMGLFYALSIIRFATKIKRINLGLSYIGRMSMSNYLLQSLLGFVVFKGLGFYGESSPITNIVVALMIVGIQVYISRTWMKAHRNGPLETIWRKVTYGQIRSKKLETLKI